MLKKGNMYHHPQFAETMVKLIGRQLTVEEAAVILGVSPARLSRKKRELLADVMASGTREDRALVTRGALQASLEELTKRNDEIYEMAVDMGDMEIALAANQAQGKLLEQMAGLAGIGANAPATIVNQVGTVNMQQVVGLPGLQMYHPSLLAAAQASPISVASEEVSVGCQD